MRDGSDPRLKSLRMLQGDLSSWTSYQNLVADIADTMKERMAAYACRPRHRRLPLLLIPSAPPRKK